MQIATSMFLDSFFFCAWKINRRILREFFPDAFSYSSFFFIFSFFFLILLFLLFLFWSVCYLLVGVLIAKSIKALRIAGFKKHSKTLISYLQTSERLHFLLWWALRILLPLLQTKKPLVLGATHKHAWLAYAVLLENLTLSRKWSLATFRQRKTK